MDCFRSLLQRISSLILVFALLSCSAGPGGGISEIDDGTGSGVGAGGGPVGGSGGSSPTNPGDPTVNGGIVGGPGSPATRPTPGFTEVEMQPATSTSLPAPAGFLKMLSLNLDPLLDIKEIRLSIKNLNFEDALSPGVEFPDHFIVRLVQNFDIVDQALPPFGGTVLPEGNYSQLELELDTLQSDEIPFEALGDPLVNTLLGHSIVVDGTLQLETPIVIPLVLNLEFVHFRFVSREVPKLRIETPDAIPFFGQSDVNHLFIAFKVRTWLSLGLTDLIETLVATLDLSSLLQLVNGLLVISTDSPNPQIAAIALQIEANINTSLRFAPSADALFNEGDVQENSSSLVVP